MTTQEIRNNIIKTGIWYVEQFEKDNEFFIECLVKFSTIRKIIIMVYNALIVENKIQPIEKLDKENKFCFWNDAKEFAAGRLNNDDCIQFSKCLYVIKVL